MMGLLLMGVIIIFAIYVTLAKVYPAIFFRYTGGGDRKARAEYGRIKRESPDSPEARITEAEFIENFVTNGPSPWKYATLVFLLLLVGLPLSCTMGMVGFIP
jgi:hypothetical protein